MSEQIRKSLHEFFTWAQPFDIAVFKQINQIWTAAWADYFFPLITDLHKQSWFFLLFPALLFLVLGKKYKVNSIMIVTMLALCLAWSDYAGGRIKHVIERPRPFQTIKTTGAIQRSPAGQNASFYSNHTSNNFAMATYMSFFMPVLSWLFFAIALIVGYSRVYNGVHYPTDVLFGAFLGIIWGKAFCHLASRFLTNELRNKIWKENYADATDVMSKNLHNDYNSKSKKKK